MIISNQGVVLVAGYDFTGSVSYDGYTLTIKARAAGNLLEGYYFPTNGLT